VALLGYQADAADDPTERDRLVGHATAAERRANELDQQAAALLKAGDVRGEWFLDTAGTRDRAERAREELKNRGVDIDNPAGRVTARELLEAQHLGIEVDDLHREVTEADITDDTDTIIDNVNEVDRPEMVAEMPLPDIRHRVEYEIPVTENDKDWTRVPDMTTTRDALAATTRALLEMDQRRAWETEREAEDHAYQAAQWQATDQARADTDQRVDVLD
jgi:hypothetical protein